MKIGYVRVSTKEQNTTRQEEIMKSLGVNKVYIDKMSGKDTKRPALQEMMNFVREGDSVVVESISRFARNTKDLLELTEQLNNKHGSADEREKAGIWKGIQILCHENAQCSIRCTGKNKKISTTYQINVYNLQKCTKKIVCCRIKSRKTD